MPNAKSILPAPIPDTINVFAIRSALQLTQRNFAHAFGLRPGTVMDWEQGRTQPDATARAYLTTIARNADGVRKALRPARS